jgi:hypothetical protein
MSVVAPTRLGAPPKAPPKAPPNGTPTVPVAAAPAKKALFGRAKPGKTGIGVILTALEGWGKTTVGCYAPKPLILMARGETGYVTLRQHNRVPEVDTVLDADGRPETLNNWNAVTATMEAAIESDHETVVFDALNGFERLLYEKVCARDFGNDFSKFQDYGRGPEVAVNEIVDFVARLERIKATGKNVIVLSHVKVKPFKNPLGPDYDRFTPDCHEKTWSTVVKWADAVLFGKFNEMTEVAKSTGNIAKDRGKAIGGTDRVLYTEQSAAWVAKNRYGMPAEIEIGNEPAEVWNKIHAAINGQEQQ